MPDARDTILTAIRQALTTAHLPPPPEVALAAPPSAAAPDYAALAQQFSTELTALSGECRLVEAPEVPAVLAEIARARGATAALAWRDDQLPIPDALAGLRQAGLAVHAGELPAAPSREAALRLTEPIRLGITGVEAAIAETATLVVAPGPGRPRLAAMSVRTHVALVRLNQLQPTLVAWLAARPDLAADLRARSALTLISGPSRTADIEMTLTVGVHGPGELIVLLIDG